MSTQKLDGVWLVVRSKVYEWVFPFGSSITGFEVRGNISSSHVQRFPGGEKVDLKSILTGLDWTLEPGEFLSLILHDFEGEIRPVGVENLPDEE